jgi:hypothetical protein
VNSEPQPVVIVFCKRFPFEYVKACLDTAREVGVHANWYHGVPPPIPPLTNSAVLEALSDVKSASIVIAVGTELPVAPVWLKAAVSSNVEQGTRLLEYLFSPGQSVTAGSEQPMTATSLDELQNLLRLALRSTELP